MRRQGLGRRLISLSLVRQLTQELDVKLRRHVSSVVAHSVRSNVLPLLADLGEPIVALRIGENSVNAVQGIVRDLAERVELPVLRGPEEHGEDHITSELIPGFKLNLHKYTLAILQCLHFGHGTCYLGAVILLHDRIKVHLQLSFTLAKQTETGIQADCG